MIRVHDLVYAVGAFRLEVSLNIARGEYFVLMGPTGSGKTAVVECLAGLRRPLAGRIEIDGRDVTSEEPRRRAIGYVPQDYALFAHRTVRGNIAFGPQVHRWPRDRTEQAVIEAARLTGIAHLLDRRIPGLSGGERQRVALARALALRPAILILDEPVSALDEATRETVCGELRSLQRALGLTTVHISHNLEEALSVADRAALLRNGRIEQAGTMDALLRAPRSEFAARFMRCENIFVGETAGAGPEPGTTTAHVGVQAFVLPGHHAGTVAFVIRPENVVVTRPRGALAHGEPNRIPARLVRAVDRGTYVRLELRGFSRLVAHMSRAAYQALEAAEGADLLVTVQSSDTHVLPGETAG